MICFALVIVEIAIQVIGEKENPQHSKHYKKLDKNDDPKRFTHRHILKAIVEKCIKLIKSSRFLHISFWHNGRTIYLRYKNINIFGIFMETNPILFLFF